MQSVRFGLIGYGAWGRHHARAIASVPGCELAAVAAHSEASHLAVTTDHPAARVTADYRDLLAGGDLDVVDVVLPSDLHHPVARDALRAGRHLLLEKPMALSLAHCDELIALASDRGRVLAVGHELRLSSLWGRVKDLIDAGAVGTPLYALIELWRRPYRFGSGGWRYDPRRVGDWVLEEPIHFFDLARWYFAAAGDPASVSAAASGAHPDRPGLYDNFSAVVTFPGGGYAVVTQTLSAWEHHQTVKLTGTTGALWAAWGGATDRTSEPTYRLQLRRGDRLEDVPIDRPSGEVFELAAQVARVADAVRGTAPVACTGADGRWAVALCLAAGESLRTGRPVRLPEG